MTDEFYMNLALNEAWKYQILTFPNPAVGCVVADMHGKILSINSHKKAGFLHAEANAVFVALCEISDEFLNKFLKIYESEFGVNLSEICKNPQNLIYGDFFEISDAVSAKSHFANQILEFKNLNANFVYEFITQNHGNLLKNATAFVTLEPCAHIGKTPSCANLLKNLGFKKVVIGSADLSEKASGGGEILAQSGAEVDFGVLKDECDALLKPFLQWQNGGNFNFFKLAFSANGVITGEISNLKSRTFSHYLRNVCDALLIGGNTVRTDRPKLDTRLIANGKNPDIFIYSRQREFDKTIPLFSVADRNVQITNDLQTALNSGLVMIEGGQNLLNEIAKSVNLFLFFRSNELKNGQNFRSDLKFKPFFTAKFGSDEYGWYELISHT